VILKSGENIISNIKEGFYEDKLVCYVLDNPCKVTLNGTYKILTGENSTNQHSVSLTNWPILCKDDTVEIIPEYIVTIVEPVDQLKQLYETQILGIKENETNQNIVINEQSDSDQSD